jgi:hypothetical protein
MSETETTPVPETEKPKRNWVANSKDSPMRQLKDLWRERFSDEEKDYWHGRFASGAMTQMEMIREIEKRYNIRLVGPMQIRRFKDWIKTDESLARRTERMRENERRMQEAFPNATKDEIRAKLLRLAYAQIYNEGDFELFIKAARADVQIDTLELNREKFKESLRAKIMAGIDALAEEAKKNPTVKAAVQQLRVAIAPE